MSGFNSILDEYGNINASKLVKELNESLEFDIRYKKQDYMKKRAIKTAATYDEFKNLVSCSHLKKLNSKEVEALGNINKVNRDNKNNNINENNNTRNNIPSILNNEEIQLKNKESIKKKKKIITLDNNNFIKPKNILEFERDFNLLTLSNDKLK